jgi:nickel-type superoxide dismutase maturation protease
MKRFLIRKVIGESMLPTIKPGTLIIARRTGVYRPGRVVLIRHKGLDKIKRLQDITDTKVFVIGDNAVASTDSRSFGYISLSSVIGIVIWPRHNSYLNSTGTAQLASVLRAVTHFFGRT